MVWIAGSSRAGYDYPGPFESIVEVSGDVIRVAELPVMPGTMQLPTDLCHPHRVGFVDVEVK